jgi:Uncharacterised nucleotidyltransferase
MVCLVNVKSMNRIISSIFQRFNLEWKKAPSSFLHKQLDITRADISVSFGPRNSRRREYAAGTLTGSFASSYYEALRSTLDIDIVIAPTREQLACLVDYLQKHDYYADHDAAFQAYREQSMFNALDNETGWKIDFIFRTSRPYSQEAFRRRKAITFEGLPFFVATAEDVILSKLEWAKMGESHRQLEDAATVLKKQRQTLDRQYLVHWVASLGLEKEFETARRLSGLQR